MRGDLVRLGFEERKKACLSEIEREMESELIELVALIERMEMKEVEAEAEVQAEMLVEAEAEVQAEMLVEVEAEVAADPRSGQIVVQQMMKAKTNPHVKLMPPYLDSF